MGKISGHNNFGSKIHSDLADISKRYAEDQRNKIAREAELERRRLLREELRGWWERLELLGTEWDRETVKHLVVLNAAGVAGVSTLIAGNNTLNPAWAGACVLLAYGSGVVLAVLNMYFASRRFFRMQEELTERVDASYDLTKDVSGFLKHPKKGRIIGGIGMWCGWASAVMAVVATVALGWTLTTPARDSQKIVAPVERPSPTKSSGQ